MEFLRKQLEEVDIGLGKNVKKPLMHTREMEKRKQPKVLRNTLGVPFHKGNKSKRKERGSRWKKLSRIISKDALEPVKFAQLNSTQ